MSALGQKQTFRSAIAMSALPPKADMDASSALAQLARLLGRLAARQSQSQRAANEMSHRVLSGLRERLMAPDLVATFIDAFQ